MCVTVLGVLPDSYQKLCFVCLYHSHAHATKHPFYSPTSPIIIPSNRRLGALRAGVCDVRRQRAGFPWSPQDAGGAAR